MKTTSDFGTEQSARVLASQAASQLMMITFLAIGCLLAAGGLWLAYRAKQSPAEITPQTTPQLVQPALTVTTQNLLAHLTTPLDINFFAPHDAVALPQALRDYIKRVAVLLAEYEREAAGKLRVQRHDPQTDSATKIAATAAGVIPFTSETGEIVYLGLTVGNGTRIEAITPLAPEWEAALESDLTRAIQRLIAAAATSLPRTASRKESQPAPVDPAISEQLLKMFPNLATQSYDDMAQELRTAALEEFKAGTLELQTKVSAAQQRLAAAQANKSAAAQQEALKNFQQVQAEQAEKLKGITAWLQARLTVLQQLKAAPGLSSAPR